MKNKKIEVFESSQADWYFVSGPVDAPKEAARGTRERAKKRERDTQILLITWSPLSVVGLC